MSISANLKKILSEIPPNVKLIAVSKTKPTADVMEAYNFGQKKFGENKVQELTQKYEALPKDIEWHLIGHLQSNKVKYIAPFVALIHAVDSEKLLQEINKQAAKNNRIINCLLQIYIAKEETKFGFDYEEARALLDKNLSSLYPNIKIVGLMGMATNTDDTEQIRKEFSSLKKNFDSLRTSGFKLEILSMGMSGDYKIAIEEGSTMIRVGSSIFGERV